MKRIVLSLLTVALLASANISQAATVAPLSTPELKQTIGANGKATLVFFQNPHGGSYRAVTSKTIKR
jgi:hypothetical protein